jgi:hypothetical protein
MAELLHLRWGPNLVLRGLRLALGSNPESVAHLELPRLVHQTLEPRSPECVALMLRVAPPAGLSLREICRDHVGWSGSRSGLYESANRGAAKVAAALAEDRVPVPAALVPLPALPPSRPRWQRRRTANRRGSAMIG